MTDLEINEAILRDLYKLPNKRQVDKSYYEIIGPDHSKFLRLYSCERLERGYYHKEVVYNPTKNWNWVMGMLVDFEWDYKLENNSITLDKKVYNKECTPTNICLAVLEFIKENETKTDICP